MKKRKKRNTPNKTVPIIVLSQSAILIAAFVIYLFSPNNLRSYFALLIAYTMVDLFVLEMICLLIYYIVTSKGIKDKAFAFLVNALFIAFFVLGVSVTKKYYTDIPYALTNKYMEVSGECARVSVDHGRASHVDLYIENMKFRLKIGYKDSIKKGSLYRIVYLPNSHEVIAVYTSN